MQLRVFVRIALSARRWFHVDRSGQSAAVVTSPSSPRVRQVQGSLVLQAVTLADTGLYTCVVNNSVGTERVSTSLVVSGQCFTGHLRATNSHVASNPRNSWRIAPS